MLLLLLLCNLDKYPQTNFTVFRRFNEDGASGRAASGHPVWVVNHRINRPKRQLELQFW